MHLEAFRDYCLKKSGATEETPFGEDTLVFKVAGKMFALAGLDEEPARQFDEIPPDETRAQEDLPPAPPVQSRGRTLEPHRVAVRDPERRKQRRERVANERGVEVVQVARADYDQPREHRYSCNQ